MPDGLLFVAALIAVPLASYRFWRLMGRDDITGWLRGLLSDGWALKLITCEWCAGTWTTLATFWLTHVFVIDLVTGAVRNRVGLGALFAVAGSAVVGLIGTAVDK